MRRPIVAVVALCGLMPALAIELAAQETILLRYHPSKRMVVRTVSWTDAEMKIPLGGLLGLAADLGEGMAAAFGADTADVSIRDSLDAAMAEFGSDSLTIQMEMRQYLTEDVFEVQSDRYSVFRTIDSIRARARTQDEAWEALPTDRLPATSATIVFSDRLEISQFELLKPDSVGEMLQGFLRAPHGGIELGLPVDPVSAGSTWSTEVTFPFDLTKSLDAGSTPTLIEAADLVAQANVTLDSFVVAPRDTLAYMSVSGQFAPVTASEIEDGVEGTTTVSGAFATRVIWSTGWNAFVSGSSRAVLIMDMQLGGEGQLGSIKMEIRFNITNRFQVRR